MTCSRAGLRLVNALEPCLERSLEPNHRRRAPHIAEGVVRKAFTGWVERTIKRAHIVRNGEPDNPAYLIVQDSGAEVLKKHSELSRVQA